MNTRRNTYILILLFIGVLMGALDISIVGPAIPSIEKTIRVTEKDLSWIFSIYVLFNLVGISLMTKLSDLFGRKWIYILAVAIFGTGSLLVSVSHNITYLLIGRAIQGFGSSGIFPVALAVIGDVFPVEKRGRALGLIGAVFGLAFLIGPFIAGSMLLYFNWNALFLINIPFVILLIIFAFALLPGKTVDKPVKFDWTGIILMGIILASFTLGMNNIDSDNVLESLGSWAVLPFFLVVVIMTPMLLMMEAQTKDPVLNVKLFTSVQTRIVGFIAFGLGLFQSSIIFMPKLAVSLFSVKPAEASFMLLPVVIATAIGSPVNGRLIDKIGSRYIIQAGLFITLIGLALFSVSMQTLFMFYTAGALLGYGLSMRASLNYIMLNEVGAAERAATQGNLIIFISVGQITGAALVGIITSSAAGITTGFSITYMAMTALAITLFSISFFLKTRVRELQK